jgi:hypothetical protein
MGKLHLRGKKDRNNNYNSTMLATLKLKHKPVASHNKTMDTFLYKIADFSLTHAKSIVITSAIIIVVAIFFAAQMQFYCQKMDARPSNNSQ